MPYRFQTMRRAERIKKGTMTVGAKAMFHARALYNNPFRLLTAESRHKFIFIPIHGNKKNPTKIYVEMVHSPRNHFFIEYVIVKRQLKDKQWQRAIIDVRPINIEGEMVEYYHAKEGFNRIYGQPLPEHLDHDD